MFKNITMPVRFWVAITIITTLCNRSLSVNERLRNMEDRVELYGILEGGSYNFFLFLLINYLFNKANILIIYGAQWP